MNDMSASMRTYAIPTRSACTAARAAPAAVQVRQPARRAPRDPQPRRPWQGVLAGVRALVEPVVQAAVLHVLVHHAAALRARAQQQQQVRVPDLAQDLQLHVVR